MQHVSHVRIRMFTALLINDTTSVVLTMTAVRDIISTVMSYNQFITQVHNITMHM